MTSTLMRFAATSFLFGSLLMAAPAAKNTGGAVNKQVETLALAAFDLQDKGDLEGAIAKFREAHLLKPTDKNINQSLADVLNSTGVDLYNKRDFTGASARFSEALALVPKFARAKENLGKVTSAQFVADGSALYKAGNIEQAREKYAQAVAADPASQSAKANLATAEADILVKTGDLTAAVAKRKEALSYAPDNSNLKQRYDDAVAQATAAAAAAEAAKKAEEEKKK